jgi:hypothetical protein
MFHPPARKGKDELGGHGTGGGASQLQLGSAQQATWSRSATLPQRKSSHSSNTPRDLLTDYCYLHIGTILPKKYTLPAHLTAGPRVLSLTKTAPPSQRPSTSPPSTAKSSTRCVSRELPSPHLSISRRDRSILFGNDYSTSLTLTCSSSQTEIGNTITQPKPKQTTKAT